MQKVSQTSLMRWLGYALAVAVGLVALVSGIASGAGLLAGAGAGWLVDSAILIIRGESARVEGQDDSVFAIFDNLPAWLWGLCLAILVLGGGLGYLVKH